MRLFSTIIINLISIGLLAQTTSWNEYELKEHWKVNGADELEGIYENIAKLYIEPKYTLGLIKTSNGYNLIYLKGDFNGTSGDQSSYWNIGDVKSKLYSTANPLIFMADHYMADKRLNTNVVFTFEDGIMNLIYTDGRPMVTYLKLYPIPSDNIPQSVNPPKIGSGTGFGVSSDGMIVTNYHVINGARSIKLRGINSDFKKTYKAKVLVSDKNNDLALIQIDENGFVALDSIPFTIKTTLSGVGENIFVLGYPLRASMGDEIKLTNGIVSSKTGFQGDITSYQISAPVQPGNSGGPVFDNQGNLIGIINAKHTGAENASYAIKSGYLTGLIQLLPRSPNLPTTNLLADKSLTQQVELVKKFVYIIETE